MLASSAAEPVAALELRDCSVRYGTQPALHGIDLRILPGERVALIGPSGAGKSTLLRALYRSAPQRCAVVAQAYDLVPQLPVFANVDAGRLDQRSALHNLGNLLLPRRADRAEVAGLLAALGLDGLERRRVGELSGGQQQRVAIARALYARRPVLLADEPVAAVDPTRADEILALVLDRSETCVLAMHAVEPALASCKRVIALRDGRIAFDLPSAEVDPQRLTTLFATA